MPIAVQTVMQPLLRAIEKSLSARFVMVRDALVFMVHIGHMSLHGMLVSEPHHTISHHLPNHHAVYDLYIAFPFSLSPIAYALSLFCNAHSSALSHAAFMPLTKALTIHSILHGTCRYAHPY